MKWEMEVLSPASYLSSTNWLTEEREATRWTAAENKMFENALAVYDKDSPDRWHKVAAMIPGKTVGDVIKQYRELEADVNSIEAGLIPIPGYAHSPFTLDWASSNNSFDSCKQSYAYNGKRCSSNQERKKGVPWTEEEHKLFLMGLKKHGKGDWRNIARNFVVTRTPTQVASHAQKYFIRQHSGGKDKRRASIHDITTVNLDEITIPSPDNSERSSFSDQNRVLSQHSNPISTNFNWNQINDTGFDLGNGSMLMSSPFGFGPNGYEFGTGPQSIGFQMIPGQHFP